MPDKIELRAKTNKDLLIMTVMQGNETVRHLELINGTLKNHENRLTIVETQEGQAFSIEGPDPRTINLSKAQAIGIGSGLFLFGSFIAGLIAGLF